MRNHSLPEKLSRELRNQGIVASFSLCCHRSSHESQNKQFTGRFASVRMRFAKRSTLCPPRNMGDGQYFVKWLLMWLVLIFSSRLLCGALGRGLYTTGVDRVWLWCRCCSAIVSPTANKELAQTSYFMASNRCCLKPSLHKHINTFKSRMTTNVCPFFFNCLQPALDDDVSPIQTNFSCLLLHSSSLQVVKLGGKSPSDRALEAEIALWICFYRFHSQVKEKTGSIT